MSLFNQSQLKSINEVSETLKSEKIESAKQFKVNKKPIRLIETFSGIGAQAAAMDRLNANYEAYKTSEWDVNAVASYKSVHNHDDHTDYSANMSDEEITDILFNKFCISGDGKTPLSLDTIKRKGEAWRREVYNNFRATNNIGSIVTAHAEDFEIVDKDKYDYMLTYSFPCVTEDMLILTSDGYKQMKDISVGDVVLTKSNTWHPIVKKFDNGVHKTCYVDAYGFVDLHVTPNHKFYVRTKTKDGGLSEPEFKEVKDMTKGDYFGIPIIRDEVPFYTDDLDFWYIVGYYIKAGQIDHKHIGYDIRLSCNDKQIPKFTSHVDADKWGYKLNCKGTGNQRIRFANKELYSFLLETIGRGTINKRIPTSIIRLPKPQLTAFFEGLMDGGSSIRHTNSYDLYVIASENLELMYAISCIVNKLYNRPASIIKLDRVGKGKANNRHPVYMLKYKLVDGKHDRTFSEGDYIWYPFYSMTEAEDEHVYNIEVEEDHSYILCGAISKNCQDLSVAGKQAGMTKGANTRSGLLWEVERVLEELNEINSLPQFLLMENVTQVHGTKFLDDFKKWISFLSSIGYKTYWRDMNSKNYGVAQNRDRTFALSIHQDAYKINYKFPEPFPLDKVMKDYLDEQVDAKYFIKSKKAKELIEKLILNGDLPKDPADAPSNF